MVALRIQIDLVLIQDVVKEPWGPSESRDVENWARTVLARARSLQVLEERIVAKWVHRQGRKKKFQQVSMAARVGILTHQSSEYRRANLEEQEQQEWVRRLKK